MIRQRLFLSLSAILICASGCTMSRSSIEHRSAFQSSGTIVLSREIPTASPETDESISFGPVLGYLPPTASFLPADNEPWLSIQKDQKKISLYVGTRKVKDFQAAGTIDVDRGSYSLKRKDENPLWYAPDEYFTKRLLNVPAAKDPIRYRRGALGSLALYFTPTFALHSALVCSDEVGGLKLSSDELQALYETLPLGASIVVK